MKILNRQTGINFSISLTLVILLACAEDPVFNTNSEWEIDQNDIGGSLIPWPLIDNPDYVQAGQARNIDDNELVIVYKGENQVYVYPTGVMHAVEIVNDLIDGIHLAITYCPLTKSSLAWKRIIMDDTLHFTPSGFLFNSNLMPYDFETETIWSQMRLEGVRGDRSRQKLNILPIIEIRWKSIKDQYPAALVFTGRNKSSSSNNRNAFDESLTDAHTAQSIEGERVFGIIKGQQIDIFQLEQFEEGINILNNQSTQDIILVGSQKHRFIVAFETNYSMTPIQEAFPVVMRDDTGTRWNIFGEAVEGPRKGERLSRPTSYFALFWAWERVLKDKVIQVNRD